MAEAGITTEKLDFSQPQALARVNQFVSDKTRGRIPTILEPGAPPVMVAVNAFSFKDCWQVKFDPDKTAPKPFHLTGGETADRATMRMDDQNLSYARAGSMTAIELPYADERFALTLVTSDKDLKPAELAASPDLVWLLAAETFRSIPVALDLPKFTGSDDRDLLGVLSRLGLAPSGKGPINGFGDGLRLSAVKQKTFIALDESGTEAAAATAAIVTRSLVQQPTRTEVRFDRPFVYALKHRVTGAILMIGYVADPQYAK
jgi:serpin B